MKCSVFPPHFTLCALNSVWQCLPKIFPKTTFCKSTMFFSCQMTPIWTIFIAKFLQCGVQLAEVEFGSLYLTPFIRCDTVPSGEWKNSIVGSAVAKRLASPHRRETIQQRPNIFLPTCTKIPGKLAHATSTKRISLHYNQILYANWIYGSLYTHIVVVVVGVCTVISQTKQAVVRNSCGDGFKFLWIRRTDYHYDRYAQVDAKSHKDVIRDETRQHQRVSTWWEPCIHTQTAGLNHSDNSAFKLLAFI